MKELVIKIPDADPPEADSMTNSSDLLGYLLLFGRFFPVFYTEFSVVKAY